MEKLIKLMPLVLLSVFVARLLVLGASVAEMGVIVALTGLSALHMYLEKSKTIQEIREVVNTQNEVIKKMAVELDTMRTNVSSIKLAAQMKR